MARAPGLVLAAAAAVLAAACAGGPPPEVGPPVDPRAAGEAVEVGGWYPVEIYLAGTTAEVAKTDGLQSDGWTVTVVAPSGDCPTDPMTPNKGFVCVGLVIHNTTTAPGALDAYPPSRDLPLLVDPAGSTSTVLGMRIAGMDWVVLGTSSADCADSPADEDGRIRADCSALLVFTQRSSFGGDETIGWLTVGAGKTATFELQYSADPSQPGMALYWPDGTWLALP